MRVKNTADRPLEVDGGRSLPAGQTGDVNSRDPLVERHLDAGRLVKPPRPRKSTAPEPEPEPEPEPAHDVGDSTPDPEQE